MFLFLHTIYWIFLYYHMFITADWAYWNLLWWKAHKWWWKQMLVFLAFNQSTHWLYIVAPFDCKAIHIISHVVNLSCVFDILKGLLTHWHPVVVKPWQASGIIAWLSDAGWMVGNTHKFIYDHFVKCQSSLYCSCRSCQFILFEIVYLSTVSTPLPPTDDVWLLMSSFLEIILSNLR